MPLPTIKNCFSPPNYWIIRKLHKCCQPAPPLPLTTERPISLQQKYTSARPFCNILRYGEILNSLIVKLNYNIIWQKLERYLTRQPNLPISRIVAYRAQTAVVSGLLWLLHLLRYQTRLRFGGWVFSRCVAPLSGYRERILANLQLIFPKLSVAQAELLSLQISSNIGITLTELFSPDEFVAKNSRYILLGSGFEALQAAHTQNRPSIVVSGHFGNYDVVRSNLIQHGLDVGGLYRRMNNPYFHELYIRSISKIGDRLFERGRPGLKQMLIFLKAGGTLAVLIDQRMSAGTNLDFMGQPAYTALSIAELALKLDALVVPAYAVRQADLSYQIRFEDPILHSTPEQMTQALNDSLSQQVHAHPEQWFWIHRRWKQMDDTNI